MKPKKLYFSSSSLQTTAATITNINIIFQNLAFPGVPKDLFRTSFPTYFIHQLK